MVAWSHPFDKTQSTATATATAPSLVKEDIKTTKQNFALHNKTEVPNLAPVTPDDSPASTLTSSEAEKLQEIMQMNMILERKLGEVLEGNSSRGFGRRQKSCPVIFQEGAEFWKKLG